MEGSKIQLSASELELVVNADIILTKNRIIQKAINLLNEVQEEMLQYTELLTEIKSVHPKISKGEYYKGLPYVILDYPRLTSSRDIFFIRSMFWWGNFFSCTLHLSGSFKEKHQIQLVTQYDLLSKDEYSLGINEDPWQHHFEKDNYKEISKLTVSQFRDIILNKGHVKIATRWPLTDWDVTPQKLIESWKFLMKLIA